MTDYLAGWKSTHDQWLELARRSRTATPVYRVDQFDSQMRDILDSLDVDLHDPEQRHALAVGACLVLSNLGPTPLTLQVAANVLGPLVAEWWTT